LSRGTFLIVDDEESVGRMVGRHFAGWKVVQTFDLRTASKRFGEVEDLRLVVLDLNLCDTTYPLSLDAQPFQGSFVLAKQIRDEQPTVAIVVFSAHVSGAIVNATHRVGAEFVFKGDCAENLDILRHRLEPPRSVGTPMEVPYLDWLRDRRGMTRREADVAALAVQGITRYADIGSALGISPNTVKRHVTSLLDRAGVDSLLSFVLEARFVGS
jgi:DNA-binding NarL/FixJ family response regulator